MLSREEIQYYPCLKKNYRVPYPSDPLEVSPAKYIRLSYKICVLACLVIFADLITNIFFSDDGCRPQIIFQAFRHTWIFNGKQIY